MSREVLWHCLDTDEVCRNLGVDPSKGLSESQVRARQAQFGPNVFGEIKGPGKKELLLAQFRSLVVMLLLVAASISVLLGENLDALAILAATLLNALIGFLTEWRAERALQALKKLAAPSAHLRRDSEEVEILAHEIVPGDVIILSPGSRVPADARLIDEADITVGQAILTGESAWVEKHVAPLPPDTPLAERNDMLYLGTTVTAGHGTAVVTATGAATEMGRIGRLISETPHEEAPLERAVEGLGRTLIWIIVVAAVIVVTVGVLHNEPLFLMLETSVVLAIAAVPEGLPAVTTIALAFGLRLLVERNAIVRRLPVIETLGSTTVICADKTGTLTEGRMTVRAFALGGRLVEVTGTGYEPYGKFLADGVEVYLSADPLLSTALRIGVLCNNAALELDPELGWHIHGDASEAALLVAGLKGGFDRSTLAGIYPRLNEIPFDEHTKQMVTFNATPTGEAVAFVKGAPEVLLPEASEILGPDGTRKIIDQNRERIKQQNLELAGRGLRVMALAYRQLDSSYDLSEGMGHVMLGHLINQAISLQYALLQRSKDSGSTLWYEALLQEG